jgi:hypothetical protein
VKGAKSLAGIDDSALESGRVKSSCTQVVAEVGHPKTMTSEMTDRLFYYQEYSRMELLAEKK